MQKINLRTANTKDKDFFRKIRNDNKEFFFDKKFISVSSHSFWFSKEIEKSNNILFVICIERSKRMIRIGTICLINPDYILRKGILGRFIISKSFRNKGLGHLALEEFKKICRDFGLRELFLELRKNNHSAYDFYRREGFQKTIEDKRKICMRTLL